MTDIQLCNCLDKTPNTGDHSECCAYRLSLRIAELEKWNQGLNHRQRKLLDRAKRAENKLDAVKAIREQYNNLIKQERGLVGANTVLDMIDAALEYKQGC